jgi:hypothetical protein
MSLVFVQRWVHARWELRRWALVWMRRFGVWGVLLLICAIVGIVAALVWGQQRALLKSLHLQSQALPNSVHQKSSSLKTVSPVLAKTTETPPSSSHDRLMVFENHLLPQVQIPAAIETLLQDAKDQGLTVQRGNYRPEVDAVGGFMRYRMTLPVKGSAPAVQAFIDAALLNEKALALESVQFKRERIESADVEVRLQWVVFTRLSAITAATASMNSVVEVPR